MAEFRRPTMWYGCFLLLGGLLTGEPSVALGAQEFYEDKTVRLIVGFSPGGDSDTSGRLVAQTIGGYIPGSPSVIVQNMPGAGGGNAAGHVYNVAKPDGLTVLVASSSTLGHQLYNPQAIKYDFRGFEYVGNLGPIIRLVVVRAGLPYRSVEEFKRSEKPIVFAGGSATSTSTVVGRILAAEGYNVKLVVGYKGDAELVHAVRIGEADATVVGLAPVLSHEDTFRPLLWVAPKGPRWADLPSLAELALSPRTRSFIRAISVPLESGRNFLAPPRTPQARLKVLENALEKTTRDAAFLKRAAAADIDIQWYGAKETKAMVSEALNIAPEGLAALRKTLGVGN